MKKENGALAINALYFTANSTGIGMLCKELFGEYVRITDFNIDVYVSKDSPKFPEPKKGRIIRTDFNFESSVRRVFFQCFSLGFLCRENSLLLTTDSKLPLLPAKGCTPLPIITDMALMRMPEVYKPSRVLLWKMQYALMKKRTGVFAAISEFTADEAAQCLGIAREHIYVIPCAASEKIKRVEDTELLQRVRRRYSLPERYVLCVGNFNPRKNTERLLLAFDLLRNEGKITHKLVIAGEKGWKFDRKKILGRLKHPEDVLFVGYVPEEDLGAVYSMAEVFIFPSLYEGFGIPVLKAQQCGTPVLTSACSSLPEVGGDGALYIDPYSTDEIAGGIMKLIYDKKLAKALTEAGFANAARYSWRHSAELLDRLIKELGKP